MPAAAVVGARSSAEVAHASPTIAAPSVGVPRCSLCRASAVLGLVCGALAMMLMDWSKVSAYGLFPLSAAGAPGSGSAGTAKSAVPIMQLAPVVNLVPVEEPTRSMPLPSSPPPPSSTRGKKGKRGKDGKHEEGPSTRAPSAVEDEEKEEVDEGGFGDEDENATHIGASEVSVFCFAWTPRRGADETMLHEVKAELAKCDGHAFFTDQGSPEPGMVTIEVPEQAVSRDHDNWLWHRNMVGLLPSWGYICRSGIAQQFDWSINTELDHWISAERIRANIRAYLDVLRRGTEVEKKSVDGPMMLCWGNAFLFNRALVKMMCDRWGELGKASTHPVARGCPAFMEGKQEWPKHCSQDMVYPALGGMLRKSDGVAIYGPSGCGQAGHTNKKNVRFPLTCWEAGWGLNDTELVQMVHVIAKVEGMKGRFEVEEYFKTKKPDRPWKVWYNARGVPIIHHMSRPGAHRVARELLRPMPPQTPLA